MLIGYASVSKTEEGTQLMLGALVKRTLWRMGRDTIIEAHANGTLPRRAGR